MEINTLEFKILGDERGSLISLEENKNIPFDIKRVYYIFGTKQSVIRGKHAHKNLKQILICVNGNCKILLDDSKEKKVVELVKPNIGLFVDKMIWHNMYDFSCDCVLMVLADNYYDENDYIRDYNEFVALIK